MVCGVLLGIRWMQSPRTAVRGNALSALCMAGFIVLTLAGEGLLSVALIWPALAAGAATGMLLAWRARTIRMPELIALFNGLGGAASAIVAWLTIDAGASRAGSLSGTAAVVVGGATFSGSLLAAAKLSRLVTQRPVDFKGHAAVSIALLLGVVWSGWHALAASATGWRAAAPGLAALWFGAAVVLRVGGADMPVVISLLNALSGVAAALAGFAIGHPVLVAVGGIVGAAGLVLTRIMCRAMNRRLGDILTGRTAVGRPAQAPGGENGNAVGSSTGKPGRPARGMRDAVRWLRAARRVVLIPGYGMAVAQAQGAVQSLFDGLVRAGKEVCFAIHPVAGRMPGHMHVLLAEVNIPYERFREMDSINPEFPEVDAAVVIGANDVVNPAANTAVGTPIYGMPVLDVGAARQVIVCNLDDGPGYAGVRNPLYDQPHVALLSGDARETVDALAAAMRAENGQGRKGEAHEHRVDEG